MTALKGLETYFRAKAAALRGSVDMARDLFKYALEQTPQGQPRLRKRIQQELETLK